MRLAKMSMAAVVALAVSSTPVLAQVSSPASKLSVASKSVRTGATVDRKSQAAGGGVILAVLAAAAVIAGIVILADGDDEPASP
ncbi:MAG: hypothetical protein ACREB5_04270 [Sphingomonadaceae bacterium]